MYRVQPGGARNDPGTSIAPLVTTRRVNRLPPRYRPLVGMLASPSRLAEGQWRVMSADSASIEAIVAAGGEVRLIPIRLPQRNEESIEMLLHTVLQFDGLLFSNHSSDAGSHLYSRKHQPRTGK